MANGNNKESGRIDLKQLEVLKCLLAQYESQSETQPVLQNDLIDEVKKLTDSNLPFHQNLETASATYSDFNSISFTVYDGTAIITVGGTAVTFPLTGSGGEILGASWTAEQLSSQAVTIDASSGKVYVSTIS